jgi:hypothetical protein
LAKDARRTSAHNDADIGLRYPKIEATSEEGGLFGIADFALASFQDCLAGISLLPARAAEWHDPEQLAGCRRALGRNNGAQSREITKKTEIPGAIGQKTPDRKDESCKTVLAWQVLALEHTHSTLSKNRLVLTELSHSSLKALILNAHLIMDPSWKHHSFFCRPMCTMMFTRSLSN